MLGGTLSAFIVPWFVPKILWAVWFDAQRLVPPYFVFQDLFVCLRRMKRLDECFYA